LTRRACARRADARFVSPLPHDDDRIHTALHEFDPENGSELMAATIAVRAGWLDLP